MAEVIFVSLLIAIAGVFAIAVIMLFKSLFSLFDVENIHTDPSAEYSRKYYIIKYCPHCGAKISEKDVGQNINGVVKCEKCGYEYNYGLLIDEVREWK